MVDSRRIYKISLITQSLNIKVLTVTASQYISRALFNILCLLCNLVVFVIKTTKKTKRFLQQTWHSSEVDNIEPIPPALPSCSTTREPSVSREEPLCTDIMADEVEQRLTTAANSQPSNWKKTTQIFNQWSELTNAVVQQIKLVALTNAIRMIFTGKQVF